MSYNRHGVPGICPSVFTSVPAMCAGAISVEDLPAPLTLQEDPRLCGYTFIGPFSISGYQLLSGKLCPVDPVKHGVQVGSSRVL